MALLCLFLRVGAKNKPAMKRTRPHGVRRRLDAFGMPARARGRPNAAARSAASFLRLASKRCFRWRLRSGFGLVQHDHSDETWHCEVPPHACKSPCEVLLTTRAKPAPSPRSWC